MPEYSISLAKSATNSKNIQDELHSLALIPEVRAASWINNRLIVRFEGVKSRLDARMEVFESWKEAPEKVWEQLEQQQFDALQDNKNLVIQVCCLPTTKLDLIPSLMPVALDKCGSLRWYQLQTNQYLQLTSQQIWQDLQSQGIQCYRFTSPYMLFNALVPMQKDLASLHERVLQAFDPHNISNPDLAWYGS